LILSADQVESDGPHSLCGCNPRTFENSPSHSDNIIDDLLASDKFIDNWTMMRAVLLGVIDSPVAIGDSRDATDRAFGPPGGGADRIAARLN
jgi:hypothetical protein